MWKELNPIPQDTFSLFPVPVSLPELRGRRRKEGKGGREGGRREEGGREERKGGMYIHVQVYICTHVCIQLYMIAGKFYEVIVQ